LKFLGFPRCRLKKGNLKISIGQKEGEHGRVPLNTWGSPKPWEIPTQMDGFECGASWKREMVDRELGHE
jgi:hypothetical protein